ncbi:MAG: UDP-N-acetylmuramate--L-alanine ligase [Gammaproteobacteria bacterium]|nr:UDP-N-acetylmuramate--L-alanine ligase [Gammaproteobacteria bacterium]MDA8010887.1 UDP-N-acetylmuramate--L-alanine ligase [Gammaproteobacteria bacterium]
MSRASASAGDSPMREFVKRIHLVGIGGIGMSGIAEVLLELGFQVSGSDLDDGALARLQKAGARVSHGHRAENVDDAEAVVVSGAVADDNVELARARARKIPVLPRAEMLGELMRFRKGIAVAGTHGKTTTTSLIASVLAGAGLDPTFIVGGVINSVRSNARLGRGEYMVVEADESDASFLHLQPQLAVMTNIDADHMETYGGDFKNLKATCLAFLQNLPFYGLAVLCFENRAVREISANLRKPWVSYGFEEGVDFRAVDIRQDGLASVFRVERRGKPGFECRLALPGRHNVLNALAAIAVASRLGIGREDLVRALSGFEGIARRSQLLGEIALPASGGSAEALDDYAHHPSEIAATIEAARAVRPQRRMVTVFQPHRYTRTRDLFDDFVRVLSGLEPLIVMRVYSAGEAEIHGAGGRALCRALRQLGRSPVFAADAAELRRALSNILQDGDLLLTLGAGDIGRIARDLVERGLRGGAGGLHVAARGGRR